MATRVSKPLDPMVPKDFLLGPVFAATKQTGPRTVVLPGRGLEYTVGGFHPLRPDMQPPGLDVRHARATFAILSFRNFFDSSPSFTFSLNELCHRYANSNGGRYSREIKSILADLIDSFFKVTDLKDGTHHIYRIIERIDIGGRGVRRKDAHLASSKQLEMWFNGVTLSPEFFGILQNITELQQLRLDVLTSMRSNLAQAIYLYIPSRAHHHRKGSPFKIRLSNLLEQVGARVTEEKWLRKQTFTQNKHSVVTQLDGAEMLTGTFRVDLAETRDKSDYNLLAWVEPHKADSTRAEPQSRLVDAFLKGQGQTRGEAKKRLSKQTGLDEYHVSLLERAKVKVEGNERFFEMAKALLGKTRFEGLLGEAKNDALEGTAPTKTPTHRLIHRIMRALEA